MAAGDFPTKQDPALLHYETSRAALERDLAAARQQNIVVSLPPASIKRMVDEGRYADALVAVENQRAGLNHIIQQYQQASLLKEKVTSSKLTALFDAGQYDEFISQAQKIQELLSRWNRKLEEAQKAVKIPSSILARSDNPDPDSLSRAFSELEKYRKNARPVLEVSLGTTQFTADTWYKTSVMLTNSGNAHAFRVSFSFSDEFETKRIKPVQVEAGKTIIAEIGLLPKKGGTIPLEITARYHDSKDQEYSETHEFWVNATEPAAGVQVPGSPGTPLASRKTDVQAENRMKPSTGINAGTGISHEVFITYSHKDKPVADAICASLESHAIRCWIAPRDVLPGEDFPEAIIRAITGSRIMVLIFSSHSNTSPHVIRELTKGVSNGVTIIPFRIEDVPFSGFMEYLIGLPHWLDAIAPLLEKHIDTLVQRVKALPDIPQ